MKTNKFNVVMLPSNNHSKIAIFNNDYLQDDDNDFRNYTKEGVSKQHLYFISNDKIKEGDWITDNIKIIQASSKVVNAQGLVDRREWKKIVATTDISLGNEEIGKYGIPLITPLPQIPESFIQAYIKSYNESKVIIEVELEMERIACKNPSFCDTNSNPKCDCYKIKTNSDNKVIISLKEEKLYTKDEVIALCKQAYNDSNVDSIINGCCGQLDTAEPHINESFNKWIEDNL